MTVEQAIEMFDKLAASVSANRGSHAKMQQAVQTIREAFESMQGEIADLREIENSRE